MTERIPNPQDVSVQLEQIAQTQDEMDISHLLVGPDSDQTPVLSVVMPTLNEEEGVVVCIKKIKRAIMELGIPTEIIISDSSTDRTPILARHLGAIVVEPDEMGYGYAYRYAFERARGDFIVIGDADVTYDFESLPRLLEPVQNGEADIVLGSRFEGRIEDGAMPKLHQYIGNPLLTQFLNFFYDADVSDAHSGFRVLSRDALEQLELSSDGMEFASEMLMKASIEGLRIKEVPIVYHERKGDATLHSFHDGWRHVRFMLIQAPDYVFSLPGTGFGILGLLLLTLSATSGQIGQLSFGVTTTVAGGLALITGLQLWCLAIFSAIMDIGIRKPSGSFTTWVRNHIQLEHGAITGVVLLTIGTLYLGFALSLGDSSGFPGLSSVKMDIIALTTLVLGMQVFTSSFFLSALGDSRKQ
jgi:hypothetical protein